MRVTIFESNGGGHRLTYVRQMLQALAGEHPLDLTVALGAHAAQSKAYAHQIGPWESRVGVRVVDAGTLAEGASALAVAGHKVRELGEAVRATRPEVLILPTADGLGQMLALRRGCVRGVDAIHLVVHGASFALPSAGIKQTLARRASLAALARVPRSSLHMVNALGWEWIDARGGALAGRTDVLPDPVDAWAPRDRVDARRRLGLPEDGLLIVSAGRQDRRKGIEPLVRALGRVDWSRAGVVPGATRLVLAGGLEPALREALGAMPKDLMERVILLDRYLSDEELADALGAADLVAACAPRHMGLSNIALRAASLERPVLASEYGWIGRVIPAFGLGWAGPIDDADGYARTIERAVRECVGWSLGEAGRRLVEFHQPENFRAHVRSWVGLGEGGGALAWSDAVGMIG